MLEIRQKGLQVSLPLLNKTDAHLATLVAGSTIAVDSNGKAKLGDGGDDNIIGFLINDAAGADWENTPASASNKVAVAVGNALLVSDQKTTGVTIAAGELLYADSDAEAGLITNVATDNGAAIGVALAAATDAAPSIEFVVV